MSESENNNKLSPREVSELLKNFYQPEEAAIQDLDEFYAELGKKLDDNSVTAEMAARREAVEADYQKREVQLKKMLDDIDLKAQNNKSSKVDPKDILMSIALLTLIAVVLALAPNLQG